MRTRTLLAGIALIAGCSLVFVPSTAQAEEPPYGSPPSFVNDVVPLLTRQGCNQGACHGKNDGRNGFKLSLRGYAPELDIERLTRESRGRRINFAAPEESLILRKATGRAPHGGGAIIAPGSREHALLVDWIRAGAPGAIKDEPRPKSLAMEPGHVERKPGESQPLTVKATYSDGKVREVTWLAQFYSSDASIAEVSPAGVVTVKRQGETAVRAHFDGQVAVVLVTSPFETPVDAARLAQRNNVIDEHVMNKLAALRIPPADLCTDQVFIRRAFLDTIGTLPTPAEVEAFVVDTRGDKRAQLVDALLKRPEFVDYWALELGDLLQNRRERDHDCRGAKGVRSLHDWLRAQVAANRPWNEIARDVLTVQGSAAARPEVGYYIVNVGEKNDANSSEVVAAVAQTFLGVRIGCAQCHNHPLEKYTQDDYYHFAAFFAPLKLERKPLGEGFTEVALKPQKANEKIGVSQPRTGAFLAPATLDGAAVEVPVGGDPRTRLAEWIVDPKNEYFAGAMVNRLWRHFLGVGLVEPVDDLRASNPPSNPELWRALKEEFVGHQFNLQHVMRLILNSRTYQLASATTPGNETDTRFYSHYYARRLPAEVLLDAICQATAVPERFEGYPVGTRAIQLPEPGLDSYFLKQFGRSDRVTACACERRGEVTISQLLQLQNGESLLKKFGEGEGRLKKSLLTNADATRAVRELFLATVSRPPTAAEQSAIDQQFAGGDSKEDVFTDLFWALLNAKEFSFNH